MNYIWEMALRADEQGIPLDNVHFIPAKNPSPYMEAAFPAINTKYLDTQPVEVNVLYRLRSVFAPLLNRDYMEYRELREAIFDILLHYLAVLDLRSGLSKQEFYMLFLTEDIRNGDFGDEYANICDTFTIPERTWLLSGIARMYEVGSSLELFRGVIRELYPHSMVYFHTDTCQEVLIYLGKRETALRRRQVEFLCKIFLSTDMKIYLYWLHHFGVMGYEETVEVDQMVIF